VGAYPVDDGNSLKSVSSTLKLNYGVHPVVEKKRIGEICKLDMRTVKDQLRPLSNSTTG
jgi:hypothetical protein